MEWETIIIVFLGGAGGFGIFQYLLELRKSSDTRAIEIPKQWQEIVRQDRDIERERKLRQAYWDEWEKERVEFRQQIDKQQAEYNMNYSQLREKLAALQSENHKLQNENKSLMQRIEALEKLLRGKGFDTSELKGRV